MGCFPHSAEVREWDSSPSAGLACPRHRGLARDGRALVLALSPGERRSSPRPAMSLLESLAAEAKKKSDLAMSPADVTTPTNRAKLSPPPAPEKFRRGSTNPRQQNCRTGIAPRLRTRPSPTFDNLRRIFEVIILRPHRDDAASSADARRSATSRHRQPSRRSSAKTRAFPRSQPLRVEQIPVQGFQQSIRGPSSLSTAFTSSSSARGLDADENFSKNMLAQKARASGRPLRGITSDMSPTRRFNCTTPSPGQERDRPYDERVGSSSSLLAVPPRLVDILHEGGGPHPVPRRIAPAGRRRRNRTGSEITRTRREPNRIAAPSVTRERRVSNSDSRTRNVTLIDAYPRRTLHGSRAPTYMSRPPSP